MSTRTIKVPDIGEGIAEVELTAWHVKPGDRVTEDQPLADVMTDKANVEIPSPVSGTVVSLGGEVGQPMAVGSELIRLEVESDAKEAREAPVRKEAVTPARSTSTRQAPIDGDRPIASPAVRRRAWEMGIDLGDVVATGPAGRIMHADLQAHAALHPVAVKPRESPAAPAQRDQAIAITGVRRKIAQKMQEAKRRIPHFTYVEEVDVTELEALRARLNGRWSRERGKLTLLPFVMRAVVLAVREHPEVNARFDDEAGVVTRHGDVHLGIATQTDSGLMVPVVRHAQSLDLWASAAEVARLADAARAGRATRDELAGSTITITSLGALGGIASTPVINRPEVAIVGVNRIVERPAMRHGAVVGRLLMNLSSSFDHRVVDGHHAATFVQAVRGYLENPATLFMV